MRPSAFAEVFKALHNPVNGPIFNERETSVIIIGGASGVGKTRMSLEMAKALQSEVKHMEVQYLSLPLDRPHEEKNRWPDGSKVHPEYEDAFRQNESRLVSKLIHCVKGEFQPHSSLMLGQLLSTMFKSTDDKVKILVLNIDECQSDVATCAQMIRVLREFNNRYYSKIKILPIVTGLWVDSQSIQMIKDVSGIKTVEKVLHFLPENKVPQLVDNVIKFLGVSAVDLTHPDAVALMEDTVGWARAVVTLAFTIARLAQENSQLNWSYLEDEYQQAINDQYSVDSVRKVLSGLTNVQKLVLIALAPHPVSGLTDGRGGMCSSQFGARITYRNLELESLILSTSLRSWKMRSLMAQHLVSYGKLACMICSRSRKKSIWSTWLDRCYKLYTSKRLILD